jgi:DMSO/TMAO reductase YedYZ molybdopterin-dependent catalytic subunit
MNGRVLPKDHGYPVRAIVSGHYGMASVKWLTHIYAAREPFEGYWQTSDYGYWGLSGWSRAARFERNEAEVRNRPTKCLRDTRAEPGVHGFRRCRRARPR